MNVFKEIRLITSSSSSEYPQGSITAYVLMDDGWHTTTVPGTDAVDMIQHCVLPGYLNVPIPLTWPLGNP